MSLTNLFAKIAGRHQERQLARKADFKALVKAVAEEQEPDLEEVERILAESNKTLEDLQRAVELYLKRRALKTTVDQKPRLEKDREQINKQISHAGEALTAAETKYKETTDPLLGQRDYIRDQLLEIDRAKTELERTCDDQDLLNELANAERQLNVLHTRRNETEFAISERKRRMAWCRSQLWDSPGICCTPRAATASRECSTGALPGKSSSAWRRGWSSPTLSRSSIGICTPIISCSAKHPAVCDSAN